MLEEKTKAPDFTLEDKDGNKVVVVPFHILHLGPRQSIVLECG